MGTMSKELLDMLSEFLICEIGNKVIDGVTYAFVTKSAKDKEDYERYAKIRKEADDCGFRANEVMRVYEVINGYIFDMDLEIAKQITNEIAKAVEKRGKTSVNYSDIIRDTPDKRRRRDLAILAKKLKKEYDNGNKSVEVALFNRNLSNRIILNGKDKNGNSVMVKYDAFAIRHWDIEALNEQFLSQAGFVVRRVQPCEILPSKTGISVILTMEGIE